MSDWIGIGAASEHRKGAKGTTKRRAELLEYVSGGLLETRCFRRKEKTIQFDKSDDCEIFFEVLKSGRLSKCQFPYAESRTVPNDEAKGIKFIDWWSTPLATTDGWEVQKKLGFVVLEKQANWELGHFKTLMLAYAKPDYGYDNKTGFVFRTSEVFGVQVNSEGVARLLGATKEPGNESRLRTTQYDWERAIAAFAGFQHQHDLVPDFYAHGAQAEIERWLANWFIETSSGEPSEASIRTRAKKLLDAYKEADKG